MFMEERERWLKCARFWWVLCARSLEEYVAEREEIAP